MSDVLEVMPAAACGTIVDELKRRDPALLAELRSTDEPTADQRSAVESLLASAVINSMAAEWAPHEHDLAVERAIDAFVSAWPTR